MSIWWSGRQPVFTCSCIMQIRQPPTTIASASPPACLRTNPHQWGRMLGCWASALSTHGMVINSLAPGKCGNNFTIVISNLFQELISWAFPVKLLSGECHRTHFDDKSTLVQVMAWCHQATSHYLIQCWPRFMATYGVTRPQWVNILRLRQNLLDDIFKCNFLNESIWILIKNSLKFVPGGPIYNILALVQIMDWHRPGDKPLSEPVMVNTDTYMHHSVLIINPWFSAGVYQE